MQSAITFLHEAENQVNEAVCTPWPGSNQLQARCLFSIGK